MMMNAITVLSVTAGAAALGGATGSLLHAGFGATLAGAIALGVGGLAIGVVGGRRLTPPKRKAGGK